MSATATFERIGRNHGVPPLELTTNTRAGQAEEVYDYARKFLASSGYTVTIDEDGNGSIEFGQFGKFTVTEAQA